MSATVIERPESFVMPTVSVGDEVILLRDENDQNGSPGKVTKVTSRAISAFHFGTRREFRGVRHCTDPELKVRADIVQDAGAVWKKARHMERLEALEEAVKSLESQVERLSAKPKRD